MEGKKIWESKTFWVNLIALVAIVVQTYTGFVVTPERQVEILGVINIILRLVTKKPIEW